MRISMVHCAFCASKMIWQSDFNYDEIYDDGDGIVTFYKCSNENCGADAQFTIHDSEEK